ncbi:hypothetical protein ONV78_28170 [Hahella sp. CR1]|uniref:hypothetical protein n=1 Tax=Hahella sp. CR1 TaxID=2992807 RepID=UPI0024432544|nr:hypothetical protein [Hahella sp. CR1]MDG9671645.1 hypothetical protein [Hahella sp. CR1]
MLKKHIVSGVDYETSPIVSFALSGTDVVMRLPEHEASCESLLLGDMDIYDASLYKRSNPLYGIIVLSDSDWKCFYSDSQDPAGFFSLNLALYYKFESEDESGSLLDKNAFEDWLIEVIYKSYEELDRDVENSFLQNGGTPNQDDYWVFPKERGDFRTLSLKEEPLLMGRIGHPSTGINYIVDTAITAHHFLSFRVSFTGFRDNEIPSASEWESNKEKLLEEFLEHVNIKYPPETLEEITRYNNAK